MSGDITSKLPLRGPPPLLHLAGVMVLAFVAALGGDMLMSPVDGVAAFWAVNGVVLGVLLGAPRQYWPSYVATAVAASIAANGECGQAPMVAVVLPLVNAAVLLAAGWLLRDPGRGTLYGRLRTRRPRWAILGVGAAHVVTALLAASLLSAPAAARFQHVFVAAFLAGSLGTCILTPLLVALLRGDAGRLLGRAGWARSVPLLILFVAVSGGVFLQSFYPIAFLIMPVMLVVAVQLGRGGVALCIPILAALDLIATAYGVGPFSLVQTPSGGGRVMLAQLFLVFTAIAAHSVANLAADRTRVTADLLSERDRLSDLAMQLHVSEAGLRLISDNATDMVLRTGPAGLWTYVSAASIAILGRPAETLVGRSAVEFLHPDDTLAKRALASRLLAGEVEEGHVTFRVLHPDRGEVWIEDRARVLRDPETGAPCGYVSIWRDVTERCRLEAEQERHAAQLVANNAELERLTRHLTRARDQAEQANQAKSRFLTGISHELRTPLNGILGYTDLLRMDDSLTAMQRGRLDAMRGAGHHLLQMINRVLDLSEIEHDQACPRITDLDVRNLLNDCINLMRPVAAAKNLALSLHFAEAAPQRVTIDSTRLRQVLLNLLGNAVKFTAQGGVELRLSASAAGSAMRIEVADTGPGVEPGKRHRLFQKFDRLDIDTKSKVEGAGLGLALSTQLAADMDGALGYAPNPAGGSIFWLELPLASREAADGADGGPSAEAMTVGLRGGPRLRALVVDDVAMNRDVADAFLRAAGHDVVCVDGGAAAVEAVAAADFDVVLMDVSMPDVNGFDATRRIRALPGQTGQIPIVAMTAQVFSEQVKACKQAGMDHHLPKPFTQKELLNAVTRACRTPRPASGSAPAIQLHDATPHRPENEAPCPGSESQLPIFDQEIFDRMAAFVAPPALEAHVLTLIGRNEALLRGLRAWDLVGGNLAGVAQAAHELAGSAGMFGCTRLTESARRFERAALLGPARGQIPSADLITAIEATIQALRRTSALLPAGPSNDEVTPPDAPPRPSL